MKALVRQGAAIMVFASMSVGAEATADPEPTQQIHVRSLSPPYGVRAVIDSDKPLDLAIDQDFRVTREAHSVALSCVEDMCEPETIWLRPGASTQQLDIALNIRPAQLQIEGNFAHRFLIQEDPSLGCGCAGVSMIVPLTSGERVVHVTDLQTKQTIAVVLKAGHASLVSFF